MKSYNIVYDILIILYIVMTYDGITYEIFSWFTMIE
jgi:hypothetical protein